MRDKMVSDDVRALRLANKLKRRVKRKVAKLAASSPETKRARIAVLAISRRILETKRSTFAAVMEQMRKAA
jgi:hypothetical protein